VLLGSDYAEPVFDPMRLGKESSQVGLKNGVQTLGPSAFTIDLDLIPDSFPQALMKIKVTLPPAGPLAGSLVVQRLYSALCNAALLFLPVLLCYCNTPTTVTEYSSLASNRL